MKPTRRHLIACILPAMSKGGASGVAYASELTEGHPSVTLTQNSEQMFRMLQAGRIDLANAESEPAGAVASAPGRS